MSSLGDPMDSPLRETAEHSITTPVASGRAAPLPPRNNWSTAWDHFTVETGEEKKERCNYCGTLIKYRDGASVVLDPRCKLDYVNTFIGYLFSSHQADELKLKMTSGLKSLYEQYQGIEERSQINQEVQLGNDDDVHEMTSPHEGTSLVAIDLDD
ncbi:Zinc finger, BED-type [Sesbania bispinosa]|nr:Zinc finger, BED-type [Sesbania bispinosa]